MIVILSAVLGFWLGWQRGARAGGDVKDRWQWAAGHALLFVILGLFVTLFVDRAL